MSDPLDKAFEQRIKQSLANSTANLDGETRTRLDQMRRNALNQEKSNNWFSRLSIPLLPAAGFAACALFAVLLVWQNPQSDNAIFNADQTAIAELIENADELDMQDLDMLGDPAFHLLFDEDNHA